MLGKRDRGEVIVQDKTPLADYLTTWLTAREGELAPLSVTQYRSVIKNHLKPATIGTMPIGDIRRATATRNVVHAVLSRALGDAVIDDLIHTNPCEGGRPRGDRTREPRKFTVWTDKELRSLLETVGEDRLSALWWVGVATGARWGELLGARWLDLDLERGTLTIAQQVTPTRGGVSIAPLKTKGSHRTIRLDPDTVAALTRHQGAQKVERSLAGDAYADHDLVFADELGRPLSPQSLTEAFGVLRKAAGIRPGRLHDLRHTSATHLLTAGVPVHIVSARLGHSSPMVTLSTYAHVLPRSDAQAAEVTAAVLAGGAG
jgi:integrase